MTAPAKMGHDDISERDLYVLELPDPGLDEGFTPPSPHFGCFLAMDATRVPDDVIRVFARGLLGAGAAYFATWGPDCERVHDLIDEEDHVLNGLRGDDDVIMTSWLDGQSLDEAIWESVYVAFPAPCYESTCQSLVAIVVGRPDWAKQ